LKLDHQLNQLVLAQPLQISPFHEDTDSEIGLPGKGARKSGASPPIRAPKMAVGNCPGIWRCSVSSPQPDR
jgi:hypothetical protein